MRRRRRRQPGPRSRWDCRSRRYGKEAGDSTPRPLFVPHSVAGRGLEPPNSRRMKPAGLPAPSPAAPIMARVPESGKLPSIALRKTTPFFASGHGPRREAPIGGWGSIPLLAGRQRPLSVDAHRPTPSASWPARSAAWGSRGWQRAPAAVVAFATPHVQQADENRVFRGEESGSLPESGSHYVSYGQLQVRRVADGPWERPSLAWPRGLGRGPPPEAPLLRSVIVNSSFEYPPVGLLEAPELRGRRPSVHPRILRISSSIRSVITSLSASSSRTASSRFAWSKRALISCSRRSLT